MNERDKLRAEIDKAGELLQAWLLEYPSDPETHEWLARNGFKDPFPELAPNPDEAAQTDTKGTSK